MQPTDRNPAPVPAAPTAKPDLWQAIRSAVRTQRHMPPIQPVARTEALPLSFQQERLWIFHNLQPGNTAFNLSLAFALTGPLNIAALRHSLNAIVQRHEIFRTRFLAHDGIPRQVIDESLVLELPLTDLTGAPAAERDALAKRLMREEIQRPFVLQQGPLLRARLLRRDDQCHIFLLTFHHMVFDGSSRAVFCRELTLLYTALVQGTVAPLPKLPIQYADVAVWQRRWYQSGILEAQIAYWRRQLAGAPAGPQLWTDYQRPRIRTYAGARHTFKLPDDTVETLKMLSRQLETTLFVALLAVFQTLIFRYTLQTDLVIGSPIAGRNRAELKNIIGFLINMLALRTDLSGNPTFRALIGRVRKTVLDAYAHQDLPFTKLVETLQIQPDPSLAPLFQVMFVFHNTPLHRLDLPGLQVQSIAADLQKAPFDLTLSLGTINGEMIGTFDYNTDLFAPTTIERMAGHFKQIAASVGRNPDQRLGAVRLRDEGSS